MEEPRQDPTQEYEAPKAEDVATDDAPSITAAGKTGAEGAGS